MFGIVATGHAASWRNYISPHNEKHRNHWTDEVTVSGNHGHDNCFVTIKSISSLQMLAEATPGQGKNKNYSTLPK